VVQVAGSKLYATAMGAKELLDGLDKVVELLQSKYHGCHEGILERLRESQTISKQPTCDTVSYPIYPGRILKTGESEGGIELCPCRSAEPLTPTRYHSDKAWLGECRCRYLETLETRK